VNDVNDDGAGERADTASGRILDARGARLTAPVSEGGQDLGVKPGVAGQQNRSRTNSQAEIRLGRANARGTPRGQRLTAPCVQSGSEQAPAYAALDLGTNNCRLLVARPTRRGFHVIDAFSRIIRLGEGVSVTGRLSDTAMGRTRDALRVCAAKMARHNVVGSRLVATEACRAAENGGAFIESVRQDLGLEIEVLSREAEAQLAVSGCASLIDDTSDLALVFDIGGGSSELIWLDLSRRQGNWRRSLADRLEATECIAAWTSLPVGVVTLAEKFGGRHVSEDGFERMVDAVLDLLAPFEQMHGFSRLMKSGRVHFLGTSGTVTTLAGIQLQLHRYDRNRVDGCWLDAESVRKVTYDLLAQSYEERVAQPCIGKDRADLVLAGCAILEALMRVWPAQRLRVADRGLREGILATLMAADGFLDGRVRRGRRSR
jgi:exopolyphosphatase / guanosine-5'-triphosphate,3'-diphosphate pyrophosphatase